MRRTATRGAGIALAIALGLSGSVRAAGAETAREVVDDAMQKVMTVLRDESLDTDARRKRIEEIAYGYFDFDTISKLVLARSWKKLDEAQRSQFLQEFKRHLSLTYGRRLDEAGEETIEIVGNREEKRGDVTVQTIIHGGEANGAEIDYRLRKGAEGWQVIDVTIEGISLITNFRSQVQEIIGREGPEGLIETLRKKNEKAEKANPL